MLRSGQNKESGSLIFTSNQTAVTRRRRADTEEKEKNGELHDTESPWAPSSGVVLGRGSPVTRSNCC